jgi:hypothetical protein
MDGSMGVREVAAAEKILGAFGVDERGKRACSFAFSSRPVPSSWKAFTFQLPSDLSFYYVLAHICYIYDFWHLSHISTARA